MEYTSSNVTIMVSNLDEAVKFYTGVLGLDLKVRYGDHWAEVTAPGITIGLHPLVKDKKIISGNSVSIGLGVDDLEKAIEHLGKNGVVFDIQKDSQVKLAYFNDPDNNALYLLQEKKKN